MKKTATELQPGDKIPPPAGERKWMGKRLMTVVRVWEAAPDKRGPWMAVRASYQSPYDEGRTSEFTFRVRPTTRLTVHTC